MTLLSSRTIHRAPSRVRFGAVGTIVGVLAVIAIARASLGVTLGLRAEYFDPAFSDRVPVLSQVDTEISTRHVDRIWIGQAPTTFSVRWVGFLIAPRSAGYTFATTSDDGSRLMIDGRTVVDNNGRHGAATRSGRIDLAAGPHLVALEYFQDGGAFAIELAWAPDGSTLAPVPSWLLTTTRTLYWKALAARVLDVLWAAVLICVVVSAAVTLAFRYRPVAAAVRRHPHVATLVLFASLAILETWPLATNPAHLSRNDNGDAMLNEWTIAWAAHQAPRAPLSLYDANIFYPERNTLSYSESMIVQSALAAPILWLGGSPVLAYNLVLLAGFALTGWTTSLVIARWTGDWAAGVIAGVVFAFNAHSLTRIPHLQAQHVEFLPLALFALDALLTAPRLRHALSLAVWSALQALTSVYLMVFTAVAIVVAALSRPEDWVGDRFRGVSRNLIATGAIATVLLIPYALPYWRLRYEAGVARPLDEVALYSASVSSYLGTPSRVHFPTWSYRWYSRDALFPGIVGLALCVAAVCLAPPWRDRRLRMCLAIGVSGVALSFGPALPGYALLYRFVPPLQGIRAATRFGYLAIAAVAMLAGFGFALIRRRLTRRARNAFAAVIVPLAIVETLAIPMGFTVFLGVPPIYRQLRNDAEAVVVELPFYSPEHLFLNARYVLASTAHWRPLMNGYSGYSPPSYDRHFRMMRRFPAPDTIAALQAEGVTRVVVHADALGADAIAQMNRVPELRRMASDGPILLYSLDRPSPGSVR